MFKLKANIEQFLTESKKQQKISVRVHETPHGVLCLVDYDVGTKLRYPFCDTMHLCLAYRS